MKGLKLIVCLAHNYLVRSSISSYSSSQFVIGYLIRKFNGVGSFDSLLYSPDSEFKFNKFVELIHLCPCYKPITTVYGPHLTIKLLKIPVLYIYSRQNFTSNRVGPTIKFIMCKTHG